MSEEIAQATADRAAELAAIRARAAGEVYTYHEDLSEDGRYAYEATIRRGDTTIIDFDEPMDAERAALRALVQAQADRRALLARLDEATAAADAAIAEYSRYAAELQAARAFIRAIRDAAIIGGWTEHQSALLAAYDAVRPAVDIGRLFED